MRRAPQHAAGIVSLSVNKPDPKVLQDFLAARFALSRRTAKAVVDGRSVWVNRQCVWIARFGLKTGDVVAVCQKSQASEKFKGLLEEYGKKAVPQWIEKTNDSFEGKIVAMPAREDIDYEVAENLIVELYSR